jgi:hypothetical protein
MAKTKNIEAFCNFCGSVTKMELAGNTSEGEESTKQWAKCKKCKQKVVIDLDDLKKETKPSLQSLKTEDSQTYSPMKSFAIGESIFHQKFNDFGVVISKELSSQGKRLIVVEFQNSGKKKLIEQ